jgi:hypothetical protein
MAAAVVSLPSPRAAKALRVPSRARPPKLFSQTDPATTRDEFPVLSFVAPEITVRTVLSHPDTTEMLASIFSELAQQIDRAFEVKFHMQLDLTCRDHREKLAQIVNFPKLSAELSVKYGWMYASSNMERTADFFPTIILEMS